MTKNILLTLLFLSSLAHSNSVAELTNLNFNSLKEDIFTNKCYENKKESIHCVQAIQFLFVSLPKTSLLLPNTQLKTSELPFLKTYEAINDDFRLYYIDDNYIKSLDLKSYVQFTQRNYKLIQRSWSKYLKDNTLTLKFHELLNQIKSQYKLDKDKEASISLRIYNSYLVSKFGDNSYLQINNYALSKVLKSKEVTPQKRVVKFPGFSLTKNNKDQYIISDILHHSSAYKKGLRSMDQVININGKYLKNIDHKKSLSLLEKTPGSITSMIIKRKMGFRTHTFSIVFRLTNEYKKNLDAHYFQDQNTLYLKLADFMDPMAHFKIIKEYLTAKTQGEVEGIILDLRGNGGGSLELAKNIADLFLDEGQVVTFTKDLKDGKFIKGSTYETETISVIDEKMTILIDEGSASASELLTQTLVDHGRAISIGKKSYGKGSIQAYKEISEIFPTSQLKYMGVRVNSGVFFGPSKNTNHIQGITPHFVTKSDNKKYSKIDSNQNPIYMNNLQKPIHYTPSSSLKKCVSKNTHYRNKSLDPKFERSDEFEVLYALDVLSCMD